MIFSIIESLTHHISLEIFPCFFYIIRKNLGFFRKMLYNDIVSSYGDFGHEKISKNAG